jgi:type I restriction enzyme S subunit
MSSDLWRKVRLGDIADIIMGQSPESKYYNKHGKGLPFLQGNRTFGFKYPTYDTYCTNGNKFAKPNDVLLSVRAPVGDLNITKEHICIGRGLASLSMKNENNDYLYYLLRANIDKLLSQESGTVFGSINRNDISNLEVLVIDSDEKQRDVSDILSTLDDKIELNRQTNATLEAIAQAIFKEWFIDFNYPGATGELVDTPLGPIPKGWRVGVLGDLCNVIKGTSYMSSELAPSRTALVTLKSINRGGGFNNNGFKEYVGKYKPDQTLDEGDLVLAQTDMTQKAEVVGSPAIVENPFEYETLVTSLDLAKCEPINEMPSSNTLYHFLERQEFKDYCLSQTNGSTVLHLRTSEIPNYEMVIPREKLLQEFDHLITPIRQSILENNKQNRTLMVIRDKLIPYLMSGEFEI